MVVSQDMKDEKNCFVCNETGRRCHKTGDRKKRPAPLVDDLLTTDQLPATAFQVLPVRPWQTKWNKIKKASCSTKATGFSIQ